jgi:hypothetical protein
MSTVMEAETRRQRATIYVVAGIVVVALVVVGLFTYRPGKSTPQAQAKADQLSAALTTAGLPAPDKQQVVRLLGEDGGAACANPTHALNKAILLSQLANGATGPGARPVIADSGAVQGTLLIVKTYCPDQLPALQKYLNGLKTAGVAGG